MHGVCKVAAGLKFASRKCMLDTSLSSQESKRNLEQGNCRNKIPDIIDIVTKMKQQPRIILFVAFASYAEYRGCDTCSYLRDEFV